MPEVVTSVTIHSKTQRIPSSNCFEFLAECDEFVRGLTFIMQEFDLGNSVFVIDVNQVVFDSSVSYGFYRLNIRMIEVPHVLRSNLRCVRDNSFGLCYMTWLTVEANVF